MIYLSDKQKKVLLIMSFGLAVVLIAFAIWIVFFKEEVLEEIETRPELPVSGLLPSGEAVTERPTIAPTELLPVSLVARGGITETEVINFSGTVKPTLGADGESIAFLNSNDGRFYRVDAAGKAIQMSDKQFFGVEELSWSKNSNKTIMEFPDGSNIMFDFDRQEQVTLPAHWDEFDFAPQSDEVAALSIGKGEENQWLITSDPNGSGALAIEPLGANADKVQVSYSPNNQTIAFSHTGQATSGDREKVLLIGKNGENLPSLTVDGGGFQPKWQPSGKKLLYSTYKTEDDWNPRLYIVNGQGDAIGTGKKDLGIKTWAEKCTFADDTTLYCAVPDELEQGMGLAPELAQFVPDTIYKIDTRTGAKSVVGKPTGNFSISDLSVSTDEGELFFNDAVSGALHKMRLK